MLAPSYQNEHACRLHDRALSLLEAVVQEAYDAPHQPGPIETGLIYRHANNIVWLAIDIFVLINEERIASPPIIARAMLESVFVLAAATRIPNFAARKAISELRELQERAHRLNIFEDEAEFQELSAQIDEQIQRLRIQYSIERADPPWTVTRCARESGSTDLARKEYFLLSQHTHSSSAGLLTRHTGTDTGIVHQSIISSLILGAAFAAQLLPVSDPQQVVDEATSMLADLTKMIENGVFKVPVEPNAD